MKTKFTKRIDTSKAYVPAVATDIRETFKRIRAQQAATAKVVTPITFQRGDLKRKVS